MSWTHSSKAIALGVLLAVALVAAGTATAVVVDWGDAPADAEVGEEVTIEAELDDLYVDDFPNEWTLQGDTDLENADWTVVVKDAGGDERDRQDVAADSIQQDLSLEDNHVTVEITVVGEVPELNEFDYDDRETESVNALVLSRVVDDGTSGIEAWSVHKYTAESQEARQAIDNARDAVEEADSEDGQIRLDEAITFYNNAEFESAIEAANEAEDIAEGEGETQRLLMIVGAVVIILAVLGGGYYYWKQSRTDRSKLQ